MVGSQGPDILVGTDRADTIVALGGEDRIVGRSGLDRICAGPGRDRIVGGADRDYVAGGPARDVLRGGEDSDHLHGNSGGDKIRGGSAADFLRPSGGNDVVHGGEGLDVVEYFDSKRGIRAHLARNQVKGWGHDRVRSVSQIEGTDFADVIVGSDALEGIIGYGGDDRLQGRGGRDYLYGDAGDDSIDGGADGDYVLFYASPNPVVVNLIRGTARGEGEDDLSRIEHLFGSPNADTLIGDARENHFIGGNGGLDQIRGRGGDDFLYASVDASFEAGRGKDTIYFLNGPAVADLTTGIASADGFVFTLAGVEAILGTGGDDQFSGNAAANVFEGAGGNDLMVGLSGEDVLMGNEGDDQLDGGPDSDRLNGGGGSDRCLNGEQTRHCETSLGNKVSALLPIGRFRPARTSATHEKQAVYCYLRFWPCRSPDVP